MNHLCIILLNLLFLILYLITFFHVIWYSPLNLLPTHPNWSTGLQKTWIPGELAALKKFSAFTEGNIIDYKIQRNFMGKDSTSHLSAHLHFGEISPQYVWKTCQELIFHLQDNKADMHHFLSEIGWREFSYHLLYHVPNFSAQPFRSGVKEFPWLKKQQLLEKWQKKTGVPIIDAAMQELWQTGYMHNRARMIVASFLTKNLLIPWQDGRAWFLDILVDADRASNSSSWQWVAGCGMDAAPYFRIFNPVIQGMTFDPNGEYVKRWLPELRNLDLKYIHQPWMAPQTFLQQAGISLGQNYPVPVADLKESRQRALAAYSTIRKDYIQDSI